LSAILINRNVSLAQGVTALIALVALQFAVTWTGVRMPLIPGCSPGCLAISPAYRPFGIDKILNILPGARQNLR
jgi:hypothetical protein